MLLTSIIEIEIACKVMQKTVMLKMVWTTDRAFKAEELHLLDRPNQGNQHIHKNPIILIVIKV